LKLSILIPAYNEEQTIAKVIDEIPTEIKSIDNVEIIVVDDGSTDKTAKVAREHGAIVFSFPQNRGLAKAISFGFLKGIERNGDILVILDADNQYDSKEIPMLVKPVLEGKADIVIGNRQVSTLEHMPVQKRIGNQLVSKALSGVIGEKIIDAQTGLRAFSKDALARLHIFSGYTYTQETLMQAKFKGLKILEIPVSFRKRHDDSRLISNIFTYAARTFSLIASTIVFYRTFKFFSILSIILFIIGGSLSTFILNHFYTTGQVSPYYPTALLAVLFIIIAAISTFFTIISSIINRQSKLLEEILYTLRKNPNFEFKQGNKGK
jgi:glycosyltransferase involved in cell wall biosynthesis